LLPPGVLRAAPGLPAVISCRVLATATFLGVDSFIPLAADRIHGASPTAQGFVIAGGAVSWTIGAWTMGRRPTADVATAVRRGFLVMLLGIVLVVPVLDSSWSLIATFVAWSVGGLGMGLLFNPTTVASMSYSTAGREGEVSSQVQLADALGFSLMGGIGGAMVAIADRTSLRLAGALSTSFALAAALACVGVIASRGARVAQSSTAAQVGVSATI